MLRVNCSFSWIVMLSLVVSAGGCCKRAKATPEARAYGAALKAHKERVAEAITEYAAIEGRLVPLRTKDPAAAARQVQQKMLPLLERMLASVEEPRQKGEAWLKVAKKARARSRVLRAVASLSRQRAALERLRATYREELSLLGRGVPPPESMYRILSARVVAAVQTMARPGAPK